MRITDVRTRNGCVPLSTHGKFEPVTMWYGTRYASLRTIIFIDTDEGITELGEVWSNAGGAIDGIKRELVGEDPFNVNAIERRINTFGGVLSSMGHLRGQLLQVTGGIDRALWDIIGKYVGQPIYKLIDGKFRDRVECRYWMGSKDPAGVTEMVSKAVALGFRAFKIKIAQPGTGYRMREGGPRGRGSANRSRVRRQRRLLRPGRCQDPQEDGAL